MKNNILSYLVMLLMGITISCSEEFLSPKPPAIENSGSYYTQLEHADQAITACYSQFNNVAAWDRNLIMGFGDIPSDDAEAGGDFVNEVPEFENFNRLASNKTDVMFEETYGTLWKAITLCNVAIERFPDIKENLKSTEDNVLLDRRIAEAKFIRAINYFYLTIVFGEVPLIDHTVGSSEYEQVRANLKDIYNLIEQDLKDAIEILPERGAGEWELGRATKASAQALLARMCLYESSYAYYYNGQDERFSLMTIRWDEALSYAEEVINSGKYQLVGIDGSKYNTWRGPQCDGFRYIFTTQGDFCPEGVFEITCLTEPGLGYNVSRGNALAKWTSARYCYVDGEDLSTNLWGLGLPTQDLLQEFEAGDPRLSTTMAYEGSGDSVEVQGGARYPISFSHSVTNTYQRKWECGDEDWLSKVNDWPTAPQNIRLIRYSDVYLIAAEAALMLNQNGKARDYINKVRERARMCGTTGVPAEITSDVTIDDIRHERRVEFACEGQRMFDIVRWNIAYDLLNGTNESGDEITYTRGQNEFQPLPEREITLSGGKMEQYPGW
ncbi:MAG: RagB/SusD family nutrient uptake outer membrane protein [Bacteroidales bacterium]|nr:RagB/SusD family nutrient uptake outer membrane protein [Bacteroidales bacterium]